MPLFEFLCSKCGKKFSQLVGMTADSSEPECPKCGGTDVSKLVSRFSRARGEEEALDSLEDASLAADPNDPRAMSRMLREMGRQMDDEGGEENFDEFIDEAERDLYDGDAGE